MGDKGGKKDKAKSEKQKVSRKKGEDRKKQERVRYRRPKTSSTRELVWVASRNGVWTFRASATIDRGKPPRSVGPRALADRHAPGRESATAPTEFDRKRVPKEA